MNTPDECRHQFNEFPDGTFWCGCGIELKEHRPEHLKLLRDLLKEGENKCTADGFHYTEEQAKAMAKEFYGWWLAKPKPRPWYIRLWKWMRGER